MDTVEATGKTLDEALHAAAEQLGLPPEALDYELRGEPRRLLGVIGSGQYAVRAWPRETAGVETTEPDAEDFATAAEVTVTGPLPLPASQPTYEVTSQAMGERAREIAQRILDLMGLRTVVRVSSVENQYLTLEIESPESQGLLIGHHGDTLDSLQYLVSIGVNAGLPGAAYRVTLDLGGYRGRQAEGLIKLAQRHADEAVASGQEAVMPGLKPYERRIVHLALMDRKDVETYSEGEGPARQLVISPVTTQKPEAQQEKE